MVDILLYGSIWQYTAMWFFDQIKEAQEKNADATFNVRINTEGGSPEYGMGVIKKIQEISDLIDRIIVDMQAHSMGLFLLCYVDKEKTEANDTAQAVLHRAAYPTWMENASDFQGSIYADILTKTNKDLEKAFRARVDVAVLEALPQFVDKNIKLKDIFSMESRVEVLLTASDLKKIGLINKINKITPTKSAEVKTLATVFADCKSVEDFKMAAQAINPTAKSETQNDTIMDLKELKEKHPAIYQAAKADGITEGIAQEKERIEAIMVFADVDLKACVSAIESGKPLSAKAQAEMMRKSVSAESLKALKKENAEEVTTETTTDEVDETEEGKKKKAKVKTFESDLDAQLGLKKTTEKATA